MYPDRDEFFDVPSSRIDEALVTGGGFVLGTMVDRIAETWRLNSVTNEPLWRQFPRRCLATLEMLGASREVDFGADFVHGETNSVRVVALAEGEGQPRGSEACDFSHYRFGAKSIDLTKASWGSTKNNAFSAKVYNVMLRWLDKADDHLLSKRFRRFVTCLEPCSSAPGVPG